MKVKEDDSWYLLGQKIRTQGVGQRFEFNLELKPSWAYCLIKFDSY